MRQKKIPQRKCVACDEMRPKKELIRLVRTPESEVKLDLTGKASGRGAYICAQLDCYRLAKKKGSLERSLKTKINDEVYAQLEAELAKRGILEHES